MIDIKPTSYNGRPPWHGYYINLPLRVTIYVGRRKGWGWTLPHVNVFLRNRTET